MLHIFYRPGTRGATPGTCWLTLFAFLMLTVILVAAPAITLAQSATPEAEPGPDPALVRAVDYLLSLQDASGGFAGLSGEPDPGVTIDAIFALKAAGYRGVDTQAPIDRALTYLDSNGGDFAATGPGQTAKLTMAVISGGQNPRNFGGSDLIATLTQPEADNPATSAALRGDSVFSHALVLMALVAANEPVPPEAIEALRETQIEDGSWAFMGTTELGDGDSNTTSVVLQALVAADHGDDPMVESGLAYLSSVQNEFGQVLYAAGQADPADANSTALAVQALIATGQNPGDAEWLNATRGLAVFQNISGGFRYTDALPADNLMATVQAIPALAGYVLPVATACAEEAPLTEIDATPAVIELPAQGPGRAACVPLAPAA